MRLQNGTAEVRESGVYKSEIAFGSGDELKIAIAGGTINYSKNGSVFYTSAAGASYPLAVAASFFDANASITEATITAGGVTAATASAARRSASSAPKRRSGRS